MSIRAVGILLLKVWGLTSLVASFIGVMDTAVLLFVRQPAGDAAMHRYVLMTNTLSAIVTLALGAVLLLGAHRIVGLVATDEGVSVVVAPDRYTLNELQSLVFGGLGVFFAIGALRNVAELVYAIARQPDWDSTGQFAYLLQGHQQELVGAVVQLLFGTALLFSRSALASAWSRIRPVASENNDPIEPAA